MYYDEKQKCGSTLHKYNNDFIKNSNIIRIVYIMGALLQAVSVCRAVCG